MKKGLFYYCLAISLIFHVLIVFLFRLENQGRREREPIAIDLVGPARWGPRTLLPPERKKAEEAPLAEKAAHGRTLERLRAALPSLPGMPIPKEQGQPAPQAYARIPGSPPSKGEIRTPGEGRGPAAQPAPAQPGTPVGRPEPSIRFAPPTQEDLMRYAQVYKELDRDRAKAGETITLDTEDLLYTSYMQGLKNRIEQIWKYPETARRDGIQGNLVMKFSIAKSGKVEDIELIKSSGYEMLDDAAKRALLDASPFNPLPDNWNKDSFTITGTFIYRLYGLYLR